MRPDGRIVVDARQQPVGQVGPTACRRGPGGAETKRTKKKENRTRGFKLTLACPDPALSAFLRDSPLFSASLRSNHSRHAAWCAAPNAFPLPVVMHLSGNAA